MEQCSCYGDCGLEDGRIGIPAGQMLFLSPKRSDIFWGPPNTYSMCNGSSPLTNKGDKGVELSMQLHLVFNLRMTGAITPFPLYFFTVFTR
jgi:hypothetical protein